MRLPTELESDSACVHNFDASLTAMVTSRESDPLYVMFLLGSRGYAIQA
jgi:hypothetical protein